MKVIHDLTKIAGAIAMGWGLWHWGNWPGLCLCLACNVVSSVTYSMAKEMES